VGVDAQPVANPADVATIEAIVRTSYEVISGGAGVPRQWRRDSTLYAPGTTFTAMSIREGKPHATTMTAEEYRRASNDFLTSGFFETEIGSRIERFGNVAIVRSAYETRRTADGPVTARGVNYFSLYYDGTRWWITSMVWDSERETNRLPASWVGAKERAP
jgi:hypothetical protein